jgi:hypothetical protein
VDLNAFPGGLTYLEVIELSSRGGDVTKQLSFKYIAARLNEAAFDVPDGVDTLLNSIDAYFADHPVGSNPNGSAKQDGKDLLTPLNDYFDTVGETFCPDDF